MSNLRMDSMNIRYYLGWFSSFFPITIRRALQEDLIERKSLVLISSNPEDSSVDGSTEQSWLEEAGIIFETCKLINYDVPKEEAHKHLLSASCIFLLGGDPVKQHHFIQKYDVKQAMQASSAVILGASAGAINLSKSWVASRELGFDVNESRFMEGIGFDDFGVLSHFDLENQMDVMRTELSPLTQRMSVYASNKDCAIRVKEGQIDVSGDVYILFGEECHKVKETL